MPQARAPGQDPVAEAEVSWSSVAGEGTRWSSQREHDHKRSLVEKCASSSVLMSRVVQLSWSLFRHLCDSWKSESGNLSQCAHPFPPSRTPLLCPNLEKLRGLIYFRKLS